MTSLATRGLRVVLESPRCYAWSQAVLGADRARRTLVEHYLGPLGSVDVVDLGCGPGVIAPYLGARSYVGYDASPAYIAAARRRHGVRGEFHVARAERVPDREPRRFGLVLALGIVHHLDDASAIALFRAARTLLVPGGRCVTLDPVFVAGQRPLARALAALDRGRHVRDDAAYAALARAAFPSVALSHRSDLLRVPYDHLILTCTG